MSGLDTGFQEYRVHSFIWGAVSHSVGQAGLELSIFLPQLLECWGAHPQLACVLFSLFGHPVQLQIHRFEDGFCSLCLPTHLHVDGRRQPLFCKFNWRKILICTNHSHAVITSLGEVLQMPCVDTRVGFYKDTGKESTAFDLMVKGDFATSEWFGSRRWPESPGRKLSSERQSWARTCAVSSLTRLWGCAVHASWWGGGRGAHSKPGSICFSFSANDYV